MPQTSYKRSPRFKGFAQVDLVDEHVVNELAFIISSTQNGTKMKIKDSNNANTVTRPGRALVRWLSTETPLNQKEINHATRINVDALRNIILNEYAEEDKTDKDYDKLRNGYPNHWPMLQQWLQNRFRKREAKPPVEDSQPSTQPVPSTEQNSHRRSPRFSEDEDNVSRPSEVTKRRKRQSRDSESDDSDREENTSITLTTSSTERRKRKKLRRTDDDEEEDVEEGQTENTRSKRSRSTSQRVKGERQKKTKREHDDVIHNTDTDAAERERQRSRRWKKSRLLTFFAAIEYTPPVKASELVRQGLGPEQLWATVGCTEEEVRKFLDSFPAFKENVVNAKLLSRALASLSEDLYDLLRV